MKRLYSRPGGSIDLSEIDQAADDAQRALVENSGGAYCSPMPDARDDGAAREVGRAMRKPGDLPQLED
jgi:hypothetical protein